MCLYIYILLLYLLNNTINAFIQYFSLFLLILKFVINPEKNNLKRKSIFPNRSVVHYAF